MPQESGVSVHQPEQAAERVSFDAVLLCLVQHPLKPRRLCGSHGIGVFEDSVLRHGGGRWACACVPLVVEWRMATSWEASVRFRACLPVLTHRGLADAGGQSKVAGVGAPQRLQAGLVELLTKQDQPWCLHC